MCDSPGSQAHGCADADLNQAARGTVGVRSGEAGHSPVWAGSRRRTSRLPPPTVICAYSKRNHGECDAIACVVLRALPDLFHSTCAVPQRYQFQHRLRQHLGSHRGQQQAIVYSFRHGLQRTFRLGLYLSPRKCRSHHITVHILQADDCWDEVATKGGVRRHKF